jgi:Fe-S cluster assembly iron-binding protein IscA
MNYATTEDKDSGKFEIIKQESLMILLDKKAIFFVVGTVMDYEVVHYIELKL